MTSADHQRQRVYDAEISALGGTMFDDPLGWDTLCVLFHRVLAHPWWRELRIPSPILRRARSDSRRSSSDGTTIRIARHGQNVLTLVHELSHHVVGGLGLVDPGHGASFRSCSLRVTELVAGSDARRLLHEAWRDAGLSVDQWPCTEPPQGVGLATAPGSEAIPLGPVPA